MIMDMITCFFLNIALSLFDFLPGIKFDLSNSVSLTIFYDILNGLCFVLPVAELLPLFFTSILISNFTIAWAIILRIKSFFPTMGR